MKKTLLRILGFFLVMVSIALICYPFISNYLMSLNHESEIVEYEEKIKDINKEKLDDEYQKAVEYNQSLLGQVVLTDPFDPNIALQTDRDYEQLLNPSGDGTIGHVKIPVLDIDLPIFHGTSEEVLLKGVGHLQNTSLPVGGICTHSVLTGHTGLSSAKLFTDLNLLKIDDIFYVSVLDKTLAYKVDNISVVKPNETEQLKIDPDHDYVTLVTCTPYGINTHRLFVRGVRIPYEEAKKSEQTPVKTSESTWMKEYKRAIFFGSVILLIIVVIFCIIRKFIKRRKAKVSEQQKNI